MLGVGGGRSFRGKGGGGAFSFDIRMKGWSPQITNFVFHVLFHLILQQH